MAGRQPHGLQHANTIPDVVRPEGFNPLIIKHGKGAKKSLSTQPAASDIPPGITPIVIPPRDLRNHAPESQRTARSASPPKSPKRNRPDQFSLHSPRGFRQRMEEQKKGGAAAGNRPRGLMRTPSSSDMGEQLAREGKIKMYNPTTPLKIKKRTYLAPTIPQGRTARRLNKQESMSVKNRLSVVSIAQLKAEEKGKREVRAVRNPHKRPAKKKKETRGDMEDELEPNAVTLEDFTQIRLIGKGTFGVVKLVRYKRNHLLYALKILDKRQQIEEEEVDHVMGESKLLKALRFPFIVKPYNTFQDDEKLYLVMQYASGSDLFSYMQDLEFDEELARFFIAQVVLTLEYLHDQNIIFRDLKPENLLVDWRGYLKLTDFSFAKKLEPSGRTETFCGTPCYIAPEIILQEGHGKEVDWWSVGVLMYEMLAGHPPFDNENVVELYNEILVNEPEYDPSRFSIAAQNLVTDLLHKDPGSRLGKNGAQEVKDHPFFEDMEWEDLLCFHTKSPLPTHMIENIGKNIQDDSLNMHGAPLTPAEQELFKDW